MYRKVCFSLAVMLELQRQGYNYVSTFPNPKDRSKMVFVYEGDEKFVEDFKRICRESYQRKEEAESRETLAGFPNATGVR